MKKTLNIIAIILMLLCPASIVFVLLKPAIEFEEMTRYLIFGSMLAIAGGIIFTRND